MSALLLVVERDRLRLENKRLKARIKRLEEAGDAMVAHAKALGMEGTGLVKRWKKSKEESRE